MNKEINDTEDIFDIAIAIEYLKNINSSKSESIHTLKNNFLYKTIYKKLLSFSKEELETVFWDIEKKEFHPNPKSQHSYIKFFKNIFEVNYRLSNPLFFAAFVEKGVFKEYYHSVVKTILNNKKSVHSLDFLETLNNIQKNSIINEPRGSINNFSYFNQNNFLYFSNFIFNFVKNLDTEEKNEVFQIFIDNLIKKDPKDFVCFILDYITVFNEEHNLIINTNLKKHNIDINAYNLFETRFPKNTDSSFFISSTNYDFFDKAYDFGFRVLNYRYKNLTLPCAIYSYGLNEDNLDNTWKINFLKKIINDSSFEEIDSFISHICKDTIKFKKYGSYFETLAKESLNKKLHKNFPNLPKVKHSKI
jgi:hypothetical protein